MRRGNVAAAAAALVLAVGGVAGCGGDDGPDDAEAAGTTTAAVATTTSGAADAAPTLTNADWDAVIGRPGDHVGRPVDIAARVVAVEPGGDGATLRVYAGPGLTYGLTLVEVADAAAVEPVAEGDHLQVRGVVAGAESDHPRVRAESIRVITRSEAIRMGDPADASASPQITEERSGLRLTLQTVERTPDGGGRITLEAVNGTGVDAQIFQLSSKLIQGGRRVEPLYSSDLPSFEGPLAPGAQATAVYRFKEMQAGPAELVIRWEPADRSIAADDFEFAFRIP